MEDLSDNKQSHIIAEVNDALFWKDLLILLIADILF